MSRHSKKEQRVGSGFVEVKSKFDAEFRRFSVWRGSTLSYEELHGLLERLHGLKETPFLVSYSDPRDGDLLPINNDDNLSRALVNARPLLRVIVQRRGESLEELNGYGSATPRPRNIISTILRAPGTRPKTLAISNPHDFRQVSSIIDVDVVPETCRRVRLVKHGSERPLGFYIRDGTSFRVTPDGMQKVPGIFISRLVPGGLAESTGLLAVNDEVLEVNGIEVAGKTLDQVTDMMVANSWNLIITVKPANQRGTAPGTLRSTTGGGGTETLPSGGGAVRRGSVSRGSQASITSEATTCSEETELDQDDILDHVPAAATTASTTPPVLHL